MKGIPHSVRAVLLLIPPLLLQRFPFYFLLSTFFAFDSHEEKIAPAAIATKAVYISVFLMIVFKVLKLFREVPLLFYPV